MAQEKDLLQQVLGRITDLPGADQVVHSLTNARERLDEMQKRLRGLDAIEERVGALERRLDELTSDEKPTRGRGSKATGPKTPKKASAGSKRTASALKRSAGAAPRKRSTRTRRSGNA